MTEPTQADRDLLAAEYQAVGELVIAGYVRNTKEQPAQLKSYLCSLRAIAKARAQGREEALREAAGVVRKRYMGDQNREDQEVLRCEAAILALIDKDAIQ